MNWPAERSEVACSEVDKTSVGVDVLCVAMNRRDLIVIRITVAVCLVLPWPVAILTRSGAASAAAVLVPAMMGGTILSRRGW